MRVGKDGATLNSRVFEALRADVLSGHLPPEHRLKVAALAASHGVSLNVIREALNRLVGEGLVDVEPQLGFTVKGLSVADLVDLVEQRVALESMALRRCIEQHNVEWQSEVLAAHHRLHRTPVTLPEAPGSLNPQWLARHDDFHRVLLEACGSPRLFQMIRLLADAAELYHQALLPKANVALETDAEHEQLLAAILDNDADRAVQVLTVHIERARDAMLPLLQEPQASRSPA